MPGTAAPGAKSPSCSLNWKNIRLALRSIETPLVLCAAREMGSDANQAHCWVRLVSRLEWWLGAGEA